MAYKKLHKKCALCSKSCYDTNTKGEVVLKRCDTATDYPKCFEPTDWRDNIQLNFETDEMTQEDRRKQAEIENPHIVAVQKEIKRRKRAREIYIQLQASGEYDGWQLTKTRHE